jgi:hypothetical protein
VLGGRLRLSRNRDRHRGLAWGCWRPWSPWAFPRAARGWLRRPRLRPPLSSSRIVAPTAAWDACRRSGKQPDRDGKNASASRSWIVHEPSVHEAHDTARSRPAPAGTGPSRTAPAHGRLGPMPGCRHHRLNRDARSQIRWSLGCPCCCPLLRPPTISAQRWRHALTAGYKSPSQR